MKASMFKISAGFYASVSRHKLMCLLLYLQQILVMRRRGTSLSPFSPLYNEVSDSEMLTCLLRII